jgi:hypothetical protein
MLIEPALATGPDSHNTFFISANCGDFGIGNPSRGSNPYMQNLIFGLLYEEGNGTSSFHNIGLNIGSNMILLYEETSPNSHGILIEFSKADVFSDLPIIQGVMNAKKGPYKGRTVLNCSIQWSEVIGSKIIFHPPL